MAKQSDKLRLGLLLNPVAGAGGPAALKGSDALATREAVFRGEITSPAAERVQLFLKTLHTQADKLQIFCARGAMGSDVLDRLGLSCELIVYQPKAHSDSDDTKAVCAEFSERGIDLLVFAGGDGTARDICDAVDLRLACLGIPSGVKMQSAVFGIHPVASAEIVLALIEGRAVSLAYREVRDIDEAALQNGEVKSRHYGELKVPLLDDLVQQVKQGGAEVDEFVVLDMTDEVRERLHEFAGNSMLVFGPGSTTHAVQRELGYPATLLGVDVFFQSESWLDVDEAQLQQLLLAHPQVPRRLILTIIGGQGHVIGRGNQQLSARNLKLLERENLWVLAAPHKLQALEGRALLIDSGDPELDADWRGLLEVITGYQKISLHRLS